MGKKIFVSYKYANENVEALDGLASTTVRDYVDILEEKIKEDGGHIYKGEKDDEDLSHLDEAEIAAKLSDRIFDSTVTIVMISKGMREPGKKDHDQWIPWEVSYSLREQSREYGNSKTNAILAVVLPDKNGLYDYFITYDRICNSRILNTNILFKILRENMFNIQNPSTRFCHGKEIYEGYSSYIYSIEWNKFIDDIDKYIEIILEIWRKRNQYNIHYLKKE